MKSLGIGLVLGLGVALVGCRSGEDGTVWGNDVPLASSAEGIPAARSEPASASAERPAALDAAAVVARLGELDVDDALAVESRVTSPKLRDYLGRVAEERMEDARRMNDLVARRHWVLETPTATVLVRAQTDAATESAQGLAQLSGAAFDDALLARQVQRQSLVRALAKQGAAASSDADLRDQLHRVARRAGDDLKVLRRVSARAPAETVNVGYTSQDHEPWDGETDDQGSPIFVEK